jgi:hypothetical protein
MSSTCPAQCGCFTSRYPGSSKKAIFLRGFCVTPVLLRCAQWCQLQRAPRGKLLKIPTYLLDWSSRFRCICGQQSALGRRSA